MERKRNTDAKGQPFTPKVITDAWRRASLINGVDPDQFRRDACGAKIRKDSYGTTGEFGWEIDHIKPVSGGGTDHKSNLQPLHWANNMHKGDGTGLPCKKKS
ncbi:MAG: HNH endonuclease [Bacillota bacterium]|jgi:hypothetical protein